MKGSFDNIKIAGIASAVPEYKTDNEIYKGVINERQVVRQEKLTGIASHHVMLAYQRASDLCTHAARKLINHLNWNKAEIKVLLFGTQNSDYVLPSTAIDLSERLGLPKDCMSYDINLGCSSFDLCVHTAAHLLQSQTEHTKAIVMVGDAQYIRNPIDIDKTAISNAMLFGAGGGVVAIEKESGNNFVFSNCIDGSGWDAIVRYPQTVTRMKGDLVFDFAINDVCDVFNDFVNDFSINEHDVDCYIFHQAQRAIVDMLTRNLNLDENKVYTSYEKYGNTSGASIPITICSNQDKLIEKEYIDILSCGFGVGLSVGTSYFKINTENILPVFETSEHFDEHRMRCERLYTRYALLMHPIGDLDWGIGRELDRESCNIGVCGDSSYIDELTSQFFWKDTEIIGTVDETVNLSNHYHAVIYNMNTAQEDMIFSEIEKLTNDNVLSSNAVVILVAEIMDESSVIDIIDRFKDKYKSMLRINAVLYDPKSLDLYPQIGDSPDWFERWIERGCDDKMKRTQYLFSAVKQLLRTDFSAISDSIIKIDINSNMKI